jgi:regulatory protein
MEITAVERNKKNRDKVSVYIDEKYCFSMEEEDFLRLNLYEKREISREEIDNIKKNINLRQAKSAAVKYLSLKYRCEKEVRNKLEAQGFDFEDIDNAIEELKSMGYINDKIYAQKYVHDRAMLRPKSKKFIKNELKNKGVPEDIIDEVLMDWDVDEDAVAFGLAKKKFGKYDLRDQKIIKKIYSFLLHRGYNFETIEGVIRNMESESQ